jgi:superfamily II DNA/RNA helicase
VHPCESVSEQSYSASTTAVPADFTSLLPRDIQVVLFSATFPEHVHQYASKFAPNANEITLQHEELTVEGIKQLYLDCADGEDKYKTLVQLYGLLTVGSSIIFVQVSNSLHRVHERLDADQLPDSCSSSRNREANDG